MKDALLEANLDRARWIPAVVDHHIHEEFALMQLLFEARDIHL
jgi:hypothetical protein